jgi:hypothetical protein
MGKLVRTVRRVQADDEGRKSFSRLSAPDTAIPDAAIPDTATPDTAIPDTAIPDTAIPDTATQGWRRQWFRQPAQAFLRALTSSLPPPTAQLLHHYVSGQRRGATGTG